MSEFKIGNVVKCTSRRGDAGRVFGLVGRVVDVRPNRIGVEWQGDIIGGGHGCGGRCAEGLGLYVNVDDIVKHIVFKGNK